MSQSNPFSRRGRLLAAGMLLLALFGLLVWYGTLSYDPAANHYPNGEDVFTNAEANVGDRIALDGTVLATDPVTVAVTHWDGSEAVVVENANAALQNRDEPIATGDSLRAFGTLSDPTTLSADRTIARATWEATYMYGVSFLGGLWVLARFSRGWRFNRDRFAFVPRDHRLALSDRLHGLMNRASPTSSNDSAPSTGEDDQKPRPHDDRSGDR